MDVDTLGLSRVSVDTLGLFSLQALDVLILKEWKLSVGTLFKLYTSVFVANHSNGTTF